MAKLDKTYAPYVEDTKKAYIEECEAMDKAMLNKVKIDMKLRYFDMLSEFYEGASIYDIADKYYVAPSHLKQSLAQIQNRVRLFLLSNS